MLQLIDRCFLCLRVAGSAIDQREFIHGEVVDRKLVRGLSDARKRLARFHRAVQRLPTLPAPSNHADRATPLVANVRALSLCRRLRARSHRERTAPKTRGTPHAPTTANDLRLPTIGPTHAAPRS